MASQKPKDNPAHVRWHCRRGMLELDLLLHTFFDQHYSQLNTEEKDLFTALLAFPDQDLYRWLIGADDCPERRFNQIIEQIRKENC